MTTGTELDYLEVVIRLCSALFIGCAIGFDRNIHGKPSGMKTMGLVALGSSLVTMASMNFVFAPGQFDQASVSRTIQGVITGVGFLGAGVIVHEREDERVRGLTTAATIWVTAALGIVCAIGAWRIAGIALLFVLALFIVGRPLERMLHRKWLDKTDAEREKISPGAK